MVTLVALGRDAMTRRWNVRGYGEAARGLADAFQASLEDISAIAAGSLSREKSRPSSADVVAEWQRENPDQDDVAARQALGIRKVPRGLDGEERRPLLAASRRHADGGHGGPPRRSRPLRDAAPAVSRATPRSDRAPRVSLRRAASRPANARSLGRPGRRAGARRSRHVGRRAAGAPLAIPALRPSARPYPVVHHASHPHACGSLAGVSWRLLAVAANGGRP